MARKAGVITIDLNAGTSKFLVDMDKANAKISQFGKAAREAGGHGVTGVQAVSGALRVMEGGLNNNLRAAERFTANVLGLGPILQAAFPVIGAIAFAGLIVKMGEEVYNFFKLMRDGPQQIAGAFREMNAPIKLANDEMQVTNDRLEMEIAKLEGKRQNTLKLALDEATVSADKLADALEKDLNNLNKLLEEKNVSFMQRIFGEAGTTDIKELFGGKSGFGGLAGEIAEINREGQAKIDAAAKAKDLKAQDVALTEMNTRLQGAYQQALEKVNVELEKARELAKTKVNPPTEVTTSSGAKAYTLGTTTYGKDERARIEELMAARRLLQEELRRIPLQSQNAVDTKKRDLLKAAAENAKLDRPLDNKLKELDEQIAAAKLKLNAAGLSETEKVIAEAEGNALKAILEVNKALSKQTPGAKIGPEAEAKIRAREATLAATNAEAAWQTRLAASTAQIKDQVRSIELLTNAIGKGYRAQQQANTEIKVMSAVGAEKYNDKQWMQQHAGDVDQLRSKIASEAEADRIKRGTEAADSLRNQIELERSLASVQMQGAEAIRLVTLAYRLRELTSKGATREQIKAEIDLFNATRANESSSEIAKIKERIAAIGNLTKAQLQGAEAVRRATLENKYADMKAQGKSPEVIEQAKKEDEAAHQQEITGKVAERLNVYKDQLEAIKQEQAKLQEMKVTEENRLDIQRASRDLEDAKLRVLIQQSLAQRGLSDGIRAFFLEMQTQAKSAGQTVYEALNSAVDRVSDSLSKALTGQKAAWGQMFQDIGGQLLKDTVKGQIQKGLGALGSKFGITIPGAGKPDGTRSNPIWTKTEDALDSGSGALSGAPGVGALGKVFGGSQGNGIFNFVSGIIGAGAGAFSGGFGGAGKLKESVTSSISYRADGGAVAPGSAYVVGERGPEIFAPQSAGTILSNAASRTAISGGSSHFYSIDARGTDPAMTEQRVRAAIIAAHNDAISTGVRVQADKLRRAPQRA
jgi:hypothetical protein